MPSSFFKTGTIEAWQGAIVLAVLLGISLYVLSNGPPRRVAPSKILVTCPYPGASRQIVGDAVAAPIEAQIKGVEGLTNMSSTISKDGVYSLTLSFGRGIDIDMARLLVQNRVTLALPILPTAIKRSDITVTKQLP